MRILVLHQHYWPEIAATAQLLTDLCDDLAQQGHDVTVICGQPSYRVAQGSPRLPPREYHSGVAVRRVPSYAPGKRSIARRLASYASFFASSSVSAVGAQGHDVALIMSTPPLLLGVSGALLRALRGTPFVYSVQDLYPDIALELGVLRPGLLSSSIDVAASALYRAAARVVTISHGIADRLVTKGVAPDNLSVIPNWADTDQIQPRSRDNAFARAHGLAQPFVVQYSGNVGMTQGLDHVLDAAARLQDLPVVFAIVGDGNSKAALEREAGARGLSNVYFLPPQPRDQLPDLLASSDVGFVPMIKGVAHHLVPSKLYGIMAAGRPVLASVESDSEVARVVREHECGLVVPPGDSDALAAAVRDLAARPEILGAWSARARDACERKFSRTVCTGQYARVLTEAAEAAA